MSGGRQSIRELCYRLRFEKNPRYYVFPHSCSPLDLATLTAMLRPPIQGTCLNKWYFRRTHRPSLLWFNSLAYYTWYSYALRKEMSVTDTFQWTRRMSTKPWTATHSVHSIYSDKSRLSTTKTKTQWECWDKWESSNYETIASFASADLQNIPQTRAKLQIYYDGC